MDGQKKNCPNGFDDLILAHLENFINDNLPILLTVWFKHLDEGDALAYFHGQISLSDIFDMLGVTVSKEGDITMDNLNKYCKEHNLYQL